MGKLDSNIYGADNNDFASGIAADALGSPSPGNPIDQAARSKGVDDDGVNSDVKIISDKGSAKPSKGNH